MRRLFVCAAIVAAMLMTPSAAFALGTVTITTPASTPTATNGAITIGWTDSLPEVLGTSFQVFRGSPTCAGARQVSPDIDATTTFTYSETPPPNATYCYFVHVSDGISADSNQVTITYDTVAPVIALTQSGGDGCSLFSYSASASDNLTPVTMTLDGNPYTAGTVITPTGSPFGSISQTFAATDGAGNAATPVVVSGNIWDPTRPAAPDLEIDTDPTQQSATLSWEAVPPEGAPVTGYHLITQGPNGSSSSTGLPQQPIVETGLQVDATYEFTLAATDVCGDGTPTVRLLRLNDTTPPTAPGSVTPTFNTSSHVVTLSWTASQDNIQVDHYEILRNGVPIGATDATTFTDASPLEHAALTYVVRAFDTNGNSTDSVPVQFNTPDWTPPNAPVVTLTVSGTTVTLRWPPATDNVGVVSYDVLRDNRVLKTMTADVRTYKDVGVKPGVHAWSVRARDDAGLTATSAPQTRSIKKAVQRATVLSLKMANPDGNGKSAASYRLKGQAHLLMDLRVVGTLTHAKLRVYLKSGRGRIAVWRGTPGSSAPRLQLGSAGARRGVLTIKLGRALHSGHIRLVLATTGRAVIVGSGKHKPTIIPA